MQWFNRKSVLLAVFLAGLLSLGVRSAGAHEITSATTSLTCNGYTITVSGDQLTFTNVTYSVNYTFNVTSADGSTFTVSNSFNVNPDVNGSFTASVTKAAGPLSGSFSVTGTATLVDNAGDTFNTVSISFSPNPLVCESSPPPPCSSPSSNASNFNGTPMQGGNFIWFNANFTAKGIPSSGATINFTNSTIQLGDTGQTLAVPNARITFSPGASCASTTFDSITNTWMTTVPIAGSDEIFLDGLAFPLPAGFSGTIGGSVVWQGSFSSNVPGISVQWKWGAAVYTHFTTDYNALQVKASHQSACGVNNSDHAGTPEGTDTSTGESFKGFVIGGARGGGGSNFTGSWSGTQAVSVCT
jgi:hypothetical protein